MSRQNFQQLDHNTYKNIIKLCIGEGKTITMHKKPRAFRVYIVCAPVTSMTQ